MSVAEVDPRSDAELVAEARAGDHAAWSALCRRNAPRLAAYLGARLRRPEVVGQLVADAAVAAWSHLPELTDAAGFAAWFRKVGAGLALKWAREHPGEMIDAPWPPGRGGSERGELARLDALIGGLEETARMALELRWRGGLAGGELAAALRMGPAEAERLADEAEAELLRRWDSR